MTRSSVFFFLFFTVSLLLHLAVASATASAGNVTSGLRYEGWAPGDTVGKCMTAAVEEEGVEAAVRRILGEGPTYLVYKGQQKPPVCNSNRYYNCIAPVVGQKRKSCPMYARCR